MNYEIFKTLLLYFGSFVHIMCGGWLLVRDECNQNVSISPTYQINVYKYGNTGQTRSEQTQSDPREEQLYKFFKKFNSPLVGSEKAFLTIASDYNLDWRLLPVVACIESSCAKYYTHNPFGWGSDTIECGTPLEDASCVAEGIATSKYYARFRESGELYYFAKSYNGGNWKAYLDKLNYFYNLLK